MRYDGSAPLPDDALHITIVHHGPAAHHNLACWLCGERPAIYFMHPEWVFAPCWECQVGIKSTVYNLPAHRWWEWWKS